MAFLLPFLLMAKAGFGSSPSSSLIIWEMSDGFNGRAWAVGQRRTSNDLERNRKILTNHCSNIHSSVLAGRATPPPPHASVTSTCTLNWGVQSKSNHWIPVSHTPVYLPALRQPQRCIAAPHLPHLLSPHWYLEIYYGSSLRAGCQILPSPLKFHFSQRQTELWGIWNSRPRTDLGRPTHSVPQRGRDGRMCKFQG